MNGLSLDYCAIGGRLRAERRRIGLSLAALAAKLTYVSKRGLSAWERGLSHFLWSDQLVELDAAGVDVSYILTGARKEAMTDMLHVRWWLTVAEIAKLSLPGLPKDQRDLLALIDQEGWLSRRDTDGLRLARLREGPSGDIEYFARLLPHEAREFLRAWNNWVGKTQVAPNSDNSAEMKLGAAFEALDRADRRRWLLEMLAEELGQ
jgi:transcriptional regulator with XRE-family HTH domain